MEKAKKWVIYKDNSNLWAMSQAPREKSNSSFSS